MGVARGCETGPPITLSSLDKQRNLPKVPRTNRKSLFFFVMTRGFYMISKEKWIVAFFMICTAVMAAVVLLNGLLGGTFYDTDHFADTLFMLGAGWRVHEGLTPATGFGHFYGGLLEQGLGMTMRFLGPGIFTFDYFTLLLTLIITGLAILALHRRMSVTGLAALALMIAALLLTRYPLESSGAIFRVVSTHSFLYNRFALAIVAIAGLFVALRAEVERDDILGGMIVGILAGAIILVKPTFIIMPPAIALGLLIQRRWQALAAFLAGLVLVILLLDPDLARWRASFVYAMAHVGQQDGNNLNALIRKAIQVPLAQPVALTLSLAAAGYLLVKRISLATILAVFILAGVGIGMTATMGGNGSLGQLALPITIFVGLAAAEIASRRGLDQAPVLRAMAFCALAGFTLPHMVNLLAAAAEGYRERNAMLIDQGPYARYLSQPEPSENSLGGTQYQMLADGIKVLNAMGNASQWGIVADEGISFEHALLARPVPGYPLWQRSTAPEFAPGNPFPPEADVVLLSRNNSDSPVRDLIGHKIREDFKLCRTSAYWEIHVRQSSNIPSCD